MPAPDYAAEIANLESAMGSGLLRVEQDGEMIIYQSIGQMQKALDSFRAMARANAQPASAQGSFGFSAPAYSRE